MVGYIFYAQNTNIHTRLLVPTKYKIMVRSKSFHYQSIFMRFIVLFVFICCFEGQLHSQIYSPPQSKRVNLQDYDCSMPLSCQLPEKATIEKINNSSYILKLESGALIGLDRINKRDLIIGSGEYKVRTVESMVKETIEEDYPKMYENIYDIHLVDENGVVLTKKSKYYSKVLFYFLSDMEAIYKIKIPPIAAVSEDYEKCLNIIHSFKTIEQCFNKNDYLVSAKDTLVELIDNHFPLQIVLPQQSEKYNGEGFYRGDLIISIESGKKIIISQDEKDKTTSWIADEKKKVGNKKNFISFLKENERGFLAKFDSESAHEKYQIMYLKNSNNYSYKIKTHFANYVKNTSRAVVISDTYVEDLFKRIETINVMHSCN